MNGNNRAGTVRDAPGGVRRIDVEAPGCAVDKNRDCAEVGHNLCGRSKRVGGKKNFITPRKSHGIHCKLQSRSRRVHCNRMLAPDVTSEFSFEFVCDRSCRQPLRSKNLFYRLHLFFANGGLVERYIGIGHHSSQ